MTELKAIPIESSYKRVYIGGPYDDDLAKLLSGDSRCEDMVAVRDIEVGGFSWWLEITRGRAHGGPSSVELPGRYILSDADETPVAALEYLVKIAFAEPPRVDIDTVETVITGLFVAAAWRGHGLAKALVRELQKDANRVSVRPQFSPQGARLFGFDENCERLP